MKRLSHPIALTLIVLVVAVMVVGVVAFITRTPGFADGSRVNVRVDKTTVDATVAATDASRQKGLAGSAPLGDTRGLLFVFPAPGVQQFWMKGMTYPIDIIWIEHDTVSEVTPNVPVPPAGTPDEALPKYTSTSPVDRVVEVSAGWATKHGVQPGDPVRFSQSVPRLLP